jgi:hypothetical protein
MLKLNIFVTLPPAAARALRRRRPNKATKNQLVASEPVNVMLIRRRNCSNCDTVAKINPPINPPSLIDFAAMRAASTTHGARRVAPHCEAATSTGTVYNTATKLSATKQLRTTRTMVASQTSAKVRGQRQCVGGQKVIKAALRRIMVAQIASRPPIVGESRRGPATSLARGPKQATAARNDGPGVPSWVHSHLPPLPTTST